MDKVIGFGDSSMQGLKLAGLTNAESFVGLTTAALLQKLDDNAILAPIQAQESCVIAA